MNIREKVENAVFRAFDEVRVLLSENERIDKSSEFRISDSLDSLAIINLLILTEQKVQDDLGVAIVLTDGRTALSEMKPLSTTKSFVDYVVFLVREAENVAR